MRNMSSRYTDAMVDLQALRFDLGAPWLNLLGSLGATFSGHPIERLTGPERLREFLEHEGLAPAAPIGPGDVELAKELRETLHPLAQAVAHGQEPDPLEVAALNEFLAADQPVRLELRPSGLRAAPPPDLRAALARIARQAAAHLTDPEAVHLRLCADEECAGAYLDPTGRRRWCSTERCGVKARVRAHRARKRAEPGL
jgi:predicted RNA-binding Zn ribbon-like protein